MQAKGAFPPPGERLFVILGAYGTGKTEFSVNLALALAAQGRKTALADLDLVNPYFRSREKATELESRGVELIAPTGALRHADLPSIPPRLPALVNGPDLAGVIDAGGDPAGSRVLASFAPDLRRRKSRVWYVLNRSRPENADAERALASLRAVEAACGLDVNGLVSNTHLIGATTAQTVREGAAFADLVSQKSGLPVACYAAARSLAGELWDLEPLFPLDLYMKRPWE